MEVVPLTRCAAHVSCSVLGHPSLQHPEHVTEAAHVCYNAGQTVSMFVTEGTNHIKA